MAEYPAPASLDWDGPLRTYIDAGDSLTVVNGGTVTLDDAIAVGTPQGYLVTATTTFSGSDGDTVVAPGVYTLLRTGTGWWCYPATGGQAVGTPTLIPVTATAPTADDEADTYTIPTTVGVVYRIGGTPVSAGVVSVGDVSTTVIVTATAVEGYEITGDDSWPLVFTAVSAWDTVAEDTFVGVDGTAITDRALSGGTYTWGQASAGDGPAIINGNKAGYAAAETYLPSASAHQLAPAAPSVTGIVGWAVEFDYIAVPNVSYTGLIEIVFRYDSDLYGDQSGRVELNVNNAGAGIDVGGTANDDTSMKASVEQVPATTIPTTGRARFEINGRAMSFYFDDVLTFTADLPGDLLPQQTWFWHLRSSGPHMMRVGNMVMETAQ